jgi:hypothetical protein
MSIHVKTATRLITEQLRAKTDSPIVVSVKTDFESEEEYVDVTVGHGDRKISGTYDFISSTIHWGNWYSDSGNPVPATGDDIAAGLPFARFTAAMIETPEEGAGEPPFMPGDKVILKVHTSVLKQRTVYAVEAVVPPGSMSRATPGDPYKPNKEWAIIIYKTNECEYPYLWDASRFMIADEKKLRQAITRTDAIESYLKLMGVAGGDIEIWDNFAKPGENPQEGSSPYWEDGFSVKVAVTSDETEEYYPACAVATLEGGLILLAWEFTEDIPGTLPQDTWPRAIVDPCSRES